ncbi:23S rRNA (uracil(1939)-C(5))-methyltransferase RlmD [bacterium]|nr:23S rRNA (uracil(1939)-C(5))-methyltransferase RlmD [bacterium]
MLKKYFQRVEKPAQKIENISQKVRTFPKRTNKDVVFGKNYNLKIDSIEHDKGNGVGRINDFVVFVVGGVTGDFLEVKITESNKNFAVASIVKIIEPSPHRVLPDCPVYKKCGGCSILQVGYSFQLKIKEEFLRETLSRIGGFDLQNLEILPIIPAENPLFYRNKIIQPVGFENGRLISGFYRQNTHEIVDFEKCFIQEAISNEVVNVVRDWGNRSKIQPYNERNDNGCLKNIFLRVSKTTNEFVVCLVTRTQKLSFWKTLVNELQQKFGEKFVGLVQNTNPEKGNVILSDNFYTLWGKDFIFEKLGEKKFKVSIASFFQVNSEQTINLYNLVKDFCSLDGTETVLDAFCGIGSIGIFACENARRLIGIEINEKAIKDAIFNAKLNSLRNAEFFVGDMDFTLPSVLRKNERINVVIVDPPRKGLSSKTILALTRQKPEKIVYISCNVVTLSRDLREFSHQGYKISKIVPVDMFPQTHHCETVCLLEIT